MSIATDQIRARNLAELNRQLEKATSELKTLEHLSQWGSDTYKWGIQHNRKLIAKLEAAIAKAEKGAQS